MASPVPQGGVPIPSRSTSQSRGERRPACRRRGRARPRRDCSSPLRRGSAGERHAGVGEGEQRHDPEGDPGVERADRASRRATAPRDARRRCAAATARAGRGPSRALRWRRRPIELLLELAEKPSGPSHARTGRHEPHDDTRDRRVDARPHRCRPRRRPQEPRRRALERTPKPLQREDGSDSGRGDDQPPQRSRRSRRAR